MRRLIMFLILLMAVDSALAEIIFEDWMEDKQSISAANHSFAVQLISSTQSAVVKMDGTGGIISLGECETTQGIKYCFTESAYPRMKIKVESLEPVLDVKKEFSTSSPKIKEDVTVKVTIKNTGGDSATSIKYLDTYSDGIIVAGGNPRVWEGALSPEAEASFSYVIKATAIGTFSAKPSLSYRFNGKMIAKSLINSTLVVQKPYTLNDYISTESADRDEVIVYNITITNSDASQTLAIESLDIQLPSQLSIVKSPSGFKLSDSTLSYKGEIGKSGSETYSFQLKSSQQGKYLIKANASLKQSAESFKDESSKEFSIGLSYVLPLMNITSSVKSNSPYSAYVALKNYGKEEIKNVSFKLESGLFENVTDKKNLAAGATYSILSKSFTAPYVETDKVYPVLVYGSYRSSSGRVYQFEKKDSIKVTAASKVVEINRTLSTKIVSPGESVVISVSAKNLGRRLTAIEVSDIFPKEIRSSLAGNVTASLTELGPNDETMLYTYSITLPSDYNGKEIEFKTIFNAKDGADLVIIKKSDIVEITVALRENKTSINESKETLLEKTTAKETGKANLFQKIAGWFKNLFS